ncbi:hypothetical protein [Shimia sp.]|uniref:hypothetical protein n=1 Tax=Shimia sp. TaxID=1954381 RepID=UPI0025EF465E|nr:hypothetical protein [Shimia sp.]
MFLKTSTRIKKLEAVLDRLKGQEIVQNRQLQALLSDDGYARYLDDCRMQKDVRETLQDKPAEVKEYEKRLKKAMFAHSKGDAASGRGQSQAGQKLLHNAQHQFERALEYLSEAIAQDPGLWMWFDRDLNSENITGTRLSPTNMPQVVTSRSYRNRDTGYKSIKRSIREIKIIAVENELDLLMDDGPAAVFKDEATVAARTNR